MQSMYDMTASDWQRAFTQHLWWAQHNKRFSGNPNWNTEGLNVLGIRMNSINSFYVRGREDWNDFLILVDYTGSTNADRHVGAVCILPCTVDPAVVNVNPKGIAHLSEGCWDSYIRGKHKGRKALIQRTNPVRVTRTDNTGKVLMHEWGYFGINIHNAQAWNRPSAGCTVIKPDRKLFGLANDRNYQVFAGIVYRSQSVDSRTYTLMSINQFRSYGFDVPASQNQ